jgi:hypothetical protein
MDFAAPCGASHAKHRSKSVPHKQTTGRYIDEAEALSLVRRRLDAGLPVGPSDLRALGVSLATDRYNEVRRVALAERGLTRRPRVRSATLVGVVLPDVPNTQPAVVSAPPLEIPAATPAPRALVAFVPRSAAMTEGDVTPSVAGVLHSASLEMRRWLRGLWIRVMNAFSGIRAMFRVGADNSSTARQR